MSEDDLASAGTRAGVPAAQELYAGARGVYPDAHGRHGSHAAHPEHRGSLRSYLAGFGLSVLLTAIPFALVSTGTLGGKQATALAIAVFAAAQIVVHMVYFLHMNARSEGGWTMMALIFTLILVVIALSGSMWVMYHLNVNMMPEQAMEEMADESVGPLPGGAMAPTSGGGAAPTSASGAATGPAPRGAMGSMSGMAPMPGMASMSGGGVGPMR